MKAAFTDRILKVFSIHFINNGRCTVYECKRIAKVDEYFFLIIFLNLFYLNLFRVDMQ